jgi:ABC-type transport system involved in cytochrome c biogenesis permease subunit
MAAIAHGDGTIGPMPANPILQIVNQYSYVVLAAGVWLLMARIVLRRQRGWRQAVLLVVAAVMLGGYWLSMRRDSAAGDGSLVSASDFRAAIGAGQPVLLQFYSDY